MRHLTDEYGSITARMSYDPYGAPLQTTTASSLGFTGELTDPSGLLYLRARTYNPALGIFTQRDPVLRVAGLSASYNGYGYVHGNPANYTDPSGEIAWFFVLAGVLKVLAGGIAGAAIVGGAAVVNDVRGQVWYNQTQLGMGFGDAFQHLDRGGLINSAVAGAEFGFNLGLGFGAGALASGLKFAGMKALAAGAMSDFGLGVTWDMAAHGDNLGTALLANALGFVGGELAGNVLNAGLRRIGRFVDDVRQELPKSGRGGNWPIVGDEVLDSRVVRQADEMMCLSACGEMLARGRGYIVSQHQIAELAGAPTDAKSVANALNRLTAQADNPWKGIHIDMRDPANFDRLIDQGSWAATLFKPDGINHAVIVNGLHDNLLEIWDPWGLDESLQQFGTRYLMQLEDFQNQWTWEALFFHGR